MDTHEIISLKNRIPYFSSTALTYFSLDGMVDVITIIDNILLKHATIKLKGERLHYSWSLSRKQNIYLKNDIEIFGIKLEKNIDNEKYQIQNFTHCKQLFPLYNFGYNSVKINKIFDEKEVQNSTKNIIFYLPTEAEKFMEKIRASYLL